MIKIYRGYIKSSKKHSALKFKDDDSNLVKYNTARQYDSFAGILKHEIMFLDIDTPEESKTLLKIVDDLDMNVNVLKTDQGAHFYFRRPDNVDKNRVDWFSPLGVQVTVKVGTSNVVEPLKIDGETRRWVRKVDKDLELDYLPKWLYTMSKKENGLSKLEDGDGRNAELFNYILKLQSVGMNKEEIRETIRLINKYVMREPLPDGEIETILRDEAFIKESFFVGNKFQFQKFGMYLISELKIIKIDKMLHIFDKGVYSDDQLDIEAAMQNQIDTLTISQRREVMAYLQIKAKENELSSPQYVALKNGIFNLDTWDLEEFDPNIIIKNKVPVPYISDSYNEVTDTTLNKLAYGDAQLRLIFEEIFGYMLLRRNEMGKAFILTGDGLNGKSTYLKVLRKLTGEENTSSLDLKELNQRFKTSELFGKLANIGDDISGEFITDNSVFKKLVTGEAINVERKGGDPFDFSNYAKLIFSANKMPRINDTSNGLSRRLMIIPFKTKFSIDDEDYDPFIQDKLLSDESMQYVLQLALVGLKRLLKNKKFTHSSIIDDELSAYEEQNNSVLAYLKQESPKLENESTVDCHRQYLVWCSENGLESTNKIDFSREVCKQMDYITKQVRIEKKRVSVFKVKK